MTDKQVVRRLASDPADYTLTMEGNPPLMVAIETGDIELAEYLLRNDVENNINTPNHLNQTALMLAAILEDYEAVKLLLKYETNLEAKDLTGKTAFLHAIETGKSDIVNCLIKSGCDVNVVDSLGQSALYLLAVTPNSMSKNKCTRIVQNLIKAGYSLEKDASWISEDDLPLQKFKQEPALIKTVRKLIKTFAQKRSSLRKDTRCDGVLNKIKDKS